MKSYPETWVEFYDINCSESLLHQYYILCHTSPPKWPILCRWGVKLYSLTHSLCHTL